MCGRTSETADEAELQAYLDNLRVSWRPPRGYRRRWNIAPSAGLTTIIEAASGRVARSMRWGWHRSWSDRLLSNAKSETVATSKTFRAAFSSSRGVVVVDSYYEWRKNPTGAKTPFQIHTHGGGLFLMAALCESGSPANDGVESCTILTAAATDEMRAIHNRMPVILSNDAALEWINPDTEADALQSIIANGVRDLEMYAVTDYVNSTSHDSELCWERAVV